MKNSLLSVAVVILDSDVRCDNGKREKKSWKLMLSVRVTMPSCNFAATVTLSSINVINDIGLILISD
jgi:hypothetical protein